MSGLKGFSFSNGLQFAFWMLRRKIPTTYHDVMQAFNVSRATAYRWLSEYEALTAKPRVPVPEQGTPGKNVPYGIAP